MFKFMRDYIMPYWQFLALALFVVILQVFLQINILQESKTIIDIGIQNKDLNIINNTGIYMIVLTVLYGISMFASSYLSSFICASVTCDVRESLFDKILSLSPYDFNKFGGSSLMTRATADTTRIQIFMINLNGLLNNCLTNYF